MASIGIDIVDVKDFAKKISRTKPLKERLFTDFEIASCKNSGIEHLASRLAAKEAFAKASGIRNLEWHDVEVKNLASGKPYFNFSGKAKKMMKKKKIELSISNIKEIAVAIAVID